MLINKSGIKESNFPLDETIFYNPYSLVSRAKGIYVWLENTRKPYIDLIMGYSSTNFGHANEAILKFVKQSIDLYDNIPCFNSKEKIELTEKLINLLPNPGNKVVYYPIGGAKAIDAAIKLAKAYSKKEVLVCFRGAFHGYSFGGMMVTDKNFIDRNQFGKMPGPVKQFDFPNSLDKDSDQKSKLILNRIDKYLSKSAHKVAAIIYEPIQGAAGFIVPPDSFLVALDRLAKKYKIISICDEIQTGIFRTGTFYRINRLNLNPDIILIGKSLAGGYYPLSAVILKRDITKNLRLEGTGFDSTFANNLLGLRIANSVVNFCLEQEIGNRVNKTGKLFLTKLEKLDKFGFLADINGIGMAFSFRIQVSKDSKKNAFIARKIREQAFKQYLILQTAGIKGDYIKLSPSLFISREEIDSICEKLENILLVVGRKYIS